MRIGANLVDHVRDLIVTATSIAENFAFQLVVPVRTFVLHSCVTPLKSVDGTEISFLSMMHVELVQRFAGTVRSPNMYTVAFEIFGIGTTAEKPQEFSDDRSYVHSFDR